MPSLETVYETFATIELHLNELRKLNRLLLLMEQRPVTITPAEFEDNAVWIARQVRSQVASKAFLVQELVDVGKEELNELFLSKKKYEDTDQGYGENPRVGNTGVELTSPWDEVILHQWEFDSNGGNAVPPKGNEQA